MNCNFCGDEVEKSELRIFVTLRGNAIYFCSKKCELNQLKLRRKARKIKWTKDYRKEKDIRKRILSEEKAKVKPKEEKSEVKPKEPEKQVKKGEKTKVKKVKKEPKRPDKKK